MDYYMVVHTQTHTHARMHMHTHTHTHKCTLPDLPQGLVAVHPHGQQGEVSRKTKYSCPVVLQHGPDGTRKGLQNQALRVQRVQLSGGREPRQPMVVGATCNKIGQEAAQGFGAESIRRHTVVDRKCIFCLQ